MSKTKRRLSRPTPFYVQATYHSKGEYNDRDRELEKMVGRPSESSGYGFGDRDLGWYYSRLSFARKLEQKLKKLRGVKVKIYDDSEEEN